MKGRSDFESLELYKEYLTVRFAEAFMKSLLACSSEKANEIFESEAKMYEFYSKRAVRFSKALVNELKLK